MARNYDNEDLLGMVELYAEEASLIANEDELSERFDEEIAPLIIEAHGEKGVEFTDTVMMNGAFNDWTDNLCKEGEIHPEQYNQYEYVGEWS